MSESFSTMKTTPSIIAPTCEVSGKDFSKSEIKSANFAKARRSFSQSSSSISFSVFSKITSSIKSPPREDYITEEKSNWQKFILKKMRE